ncbi:ATP-binding protein [Kitasatospora viridis]|uniref:Anti-sigma regulatory factor (Ser/Thr protein kinase) n=1 Tax=Kitasatospora viridis TaxID=281105 RepID=A0A561SA33_9ACTN|nr:ATP-binding protein [Kitasatospora viridis]TWF71736.1 anti-sigma regulatory factor (Ser/Thr protein kinase) [Kitasatospora viridis]
MSQTAKAASNRLARANPDGFQPYRRPYPAHPESVGVARDDLRQRLTQWHGITRVIETAVLLLSEIITNSVRHADDPEGDEAKVVVRAELRADARVLIEVIDGDPESADKVAVPAQASEPVSFEDIDGADGEGLVGGRGLLLVEAMAEEWGVVKRGDTKVVWFSLDW